MENIFIDGMIWKNPHPKAPDFIKGNVAIDMKKFVEFARKHHKDGWINIDLKQSAKTGNLYFALNQYSKDSAPTQTSPQQAKVEQPVQIQTPVQEEEIDVSDLPF